MNIELLNNEDQKLAVKRVLDEMIISEQIVNSWNSSWWEQCLNACSASLSKASAYDTNELEIKYKNQYQLTDIQHPKNRNGEPLRIVTLVDYDGRKHKCEFGRIDWVDMSSHKSTRHFSFNNNGIIKFSKLTKKEKNITPQHPRKISYNTIFNVLLNDFEINITLEQLDNNWRHNIKYDYLSLSLKDNILIEKLNDIEIVRDLNTGMRLVKIKKEYDKKENNTSVTFEVTLNPDDSLEFGAVKMETHKSNGKINGTYRFDVSRKKGVSANFYSRKGIKLDLTNNPELLGTANKLLLPIQNSNNSSDIIVSNFTNSTQLSIAKNLNKKIINFDNSDFNMEAINQAEKTIIEMVKCIRGELPLIGLINRIDYCMELINRKQNIQIEDTDCKKLIL